MDAHALLSSQGWRGTGHSLHKTDDQIGLAKPLLLNRKNNTKGLGQKAHFTSDQWWMNAFDEQLKGLDTSKEGKVVQTITTGKLNSIEQGSLGKWALYTSFVKGGFLEGTISETNEEDSSTSESDSDSKTPSQQKLETKATQSKELGTKEETKEERRARREAKRRRKEERALRRAKKAAKRAKEAKTEFSDDAKEEKRKRRARKEEKRLKRAAKEGEKVR